MIEVALDSSSGIKLEVCKICEFVWFDKGETQPLQVRPPPKPPPVLLPQKAREAIALARVQQLAEQARGPDFDSAPPDEWWKSIAAFLGMPVEFDAPAEERRPVVTWFLAAVIIMASVHSFFHLHEAVQLFGLIPAQATRMHGLTFVTSFFLHAGIIHLIGNMYFLLVFGDDVENFLRPLRYIGLIAIAAFAGDLIHIASEPNSTIPCIGASGGIAGVITFYEECLGRWSCIGRGRERLAKTHQHLRVDLIGFGQDTAGPCKLVHPLRLHQGKGHCGLM
jgi:membrane associated rhomboid family serine protease